MLSRRTHWIVLTASLAVVLGGVTYPLTGQAAAITVRAEVADASLSWENIQDLVFGDVAPGVPTTVDPRIFASAGSFEIRGASGAEIIVDVTVLPALAVGPTLDPPNTLVTNIRSNGSLEDLRVAWLGGAASPNGTQFPGVYEGTVTLTAAYTGN
jgi:hypothetical protein